MATTRKAQRDQLGLATGASNGLSLSLTEMKTRPALAQLFDPGARLRLGEGEREIRVQPHHFAGRPHFRPQDITSTPGKRLNGKTASFTAVCFITCLPVSAESWRAFSPAISRAAILAIGTPVALATKGTVREARGLTSRI